MISCKASQEGSGGFTHSIVLGPSENKLKRLWLVEVLALIIPHSTGSSGWSNHKFSLVLPLLWNIYHLDVLGGAFQLLTQLGFLVWLLFLDKLAARLNPLNKVDKLSHLSESSWIFVAVRGWDSTHLLEWLESNVNSKSIGVTGSPQLSPNCLKNTRHRKLPFLLTTFCQPLCKVNLVRACVSSVSPLHTLLIFYISLSSRVHAVSGNSMPETHTPQVAG